MILYIFVYFDFSLVYIMIDEGVSIFIMLTTLVELKMIF